ncbi:MAG TPA: hypothetical protein VFW60_09145 [Rhodanobacteraceae bacterium]|nr:hypothetical protein [Rhodanobacteraceae bacterium]
MIFIETSIFTRQVLELLTDDEHADFQSKLAANPLAGDMIENTGGLRKVRVAAQGRGKRGGAHVIYYYLGSAAQIRLLPIYAKGRKDDLSADEKRTLRGLNERW